MAFLITEEVFAQFLIVLLCNGLTTRHNGYFTFQTIIDITGARSTYDLEYVGSPVSQYDYLQKVSLRVLGYRVRTIVDL